MNKKLILISVSIFLLVLSAVFFVNRERNNRCYIDKIIDGDTIVLRDGQHVRLIGIDTPETVHPELPVQRFGNEAKEFFKKIAQGQYCRLEYEDQKKDYYGRTLAYVYTGSILLNAEMLLQGYAFVYLKYPFGRMDEFIKLEQKARHNQKGLWNYTLSDGRVANIVETYGRLNLEGRKKFDAKLREFNKKYSL